ncbi:hypothetical protein ABW19_dt0202599 [Dactylella cylindrospora]|nr:hypothetical protein ABW19_dt0202599 [Dactylella cylindrospora]
MATTSPVKTASSPKVSSRLLNMKFMQRPISSQSPKYSSSSTSTSYSSTPHSKLSHSTLPSSSKSSKNTSLASISRTAILAAKAEEESRREAALLNTSSAAEEERWSFDIPENDPENKHLKLLARKGEVMIGNVKVVVLANRYRGEDDSDGSSSESEDEGERVFIGRRYFGGWKPPAKEEKKSSPAPSDSESDSEIDSDLSDTEIERRAELKASKKREKKHRQADKALRGLTQIGGRAATQNGDLANMKCFACQGMGHKSADCPNRGRGGKRRDGGRSGEPAVKKQKRY